MNKIQNLIESNLYDLYRAFAVTGNFSYNHTAYYSWVHSDKSIFPKHIFQVDYTINDAALISLADNIKKGIAPPFIIFRYDNAPAEFINRLASQGFRQVMQWPGMAIDTGEQTGLFISSDCNLTIKMAKHEDEIAIWANIVETCLFKGEKFDRNALLKLTENEGFSFYLGLADGQPAGSLLSFTDDNHITGFYMIATLMNHRKKGIARSLVSKAIYDAAFRKSRYVVLESTPEGLSLYQHTGFQEYCKFAIYWMLGY